MGPPHRASRTEGHRATALHPAVDGEADEGRPREARHDPDGRRYPRSRHQDRRRPQAGADPRRGRQQARRHPRRRGRAPGDDPARRRYPRRPLPGGAGRGPRRAEDQRRRQGVPADTGAAGLALPGAAAGARQQGRQLRVDGAGPVRRLPRVLRAGLRKARRGWRVPIRAARRHRRGPRGSRTRPRRGLVRHVDQPRGRPRRRRSLRGGQPAGGGPDPGGAVEAQVRRRGREGIADPR